jgi:hypothetical protein
VKSKRSWPGCRRASRSPAIGAEVRRAAMPPGCW